MDAVLTAVAGAGGAAAELLAWRPLWLLTLACAAAEVVRRVQRLPLMRRVGSGRTRVIDLLLVTTAAGLVLWAGASLVAVPSRGCPQLPTGDRRVGFLNPQLMPNADTRGLTFCPVDLNAGEPVGADYFLEGTVLGKVPEGQTLVVMTRPDPETCDQEGNRGTGRFYLARDSNFHLDPDTGRWRIDAQAAYPAIVTMRFRYFLALADTAPLSEFRERGPDAPEGYADVADIPGEPELLAYFDIERTRTPPVPC